MRLFFATFAYLAFPFFCLYALAKKKLRTSFSKRLGLGEWNDLLRNISTQNDNFIWFHGASNGEINALTSIFKKFDLEYPDYKRIITTTSLTGYDLVKNRKFAFFNSLLPLDVPIIVQRIVNKIKPKLFICTETEIWPNLFFALKAKNIPIILINVRISDYSFPHYFAFRKFLTPVLDCVDLALTQSELNSERLVALGMDAAKIKVAGSTKYDVSPVQEVNGYRNSLGLNNFENIFVAGSVWPDEDQIVIDAYKKVLEQLEETQEVKNKLQLVIVPRHLENVPAVSEKLRNAGLEFVLWSERLTSKKDVLLVDTMGELARLYSVARIVFVGGSIVKNVGGHNPLEPAMCKLPVIMGENTNNFREVIQDLKSVGGLFEVENSADLSDAILKLLSNSQLYSSSAGSAFSVWQKYQGATEEIMNEVKKFL